MSGDYKLRTTSKVKVKTLTDTNLDRGTEGLLAFKRLEVKGFLVGTINNPSNRSQSITYVWRHTEN